MMKKNKLKAKIEELETKNSILLRDNAELIKDKLELKKDIYLLVDTSDESESDGLKDHYRFVRKMRKDLTRSMMFGQTGFGPGPTIKHKTGIITHIGEVGMNKDIFICDGCGKEYPIEEAVDINTPNLAGIVMCKNCISENNKYYE